MLIPIKDFSRPACNFPVLFKAYFIFKDFSRKPSKFKFFSSRCEPWKCFKNQMRDFKNLGGGGGWGGGEVTDGHTLAMDNVKTVYPTQSL